MPAPAANKRVKNKRVSRNIVIGSEAWNLPPVGSPDRPKNIPDDHTKRWTVYVRAPDGSPALTTWLNKVQFKIFNTYENPLRTCESPPFEVTETGWGGFNIDIRLHFQPLSGEKAQYRQHFLQLERYGDEEQMRQQEQSGCVRSESLDVVQFNEPTEPLFEALTAEDQWAYMDAKQGGSKAGAKRVQSAGVGTGRAPPVRVPLNERSAQLPRGMGDDMPFTQEKEAGMIEQLRKWGEQAEKDLAAELAKKEETEQRLEALRKELGPEAAQQAAQQNSGERSRRR